MGEKHSILSPSSSARWIACPGSVALSEGIPNPSSAASEEGTDAHELVAVCRTLGMPAAAFIGRVQPNGNVVDDEMVRNTQVYLDYVSALPGEHLIETWLDLSRFTGEEGGGGTGDHIAMDEERLFVTDYKNGYTPVEVAGNTQTRIYAAGALDVASKKGFLPKHVVMTIVQPRVYSEPQIEIISVEELMAWTHEVLMPAADATRKPDAALVPGEKQCQWCLAKGKCPALAQMSLETAGSGLAVIADHFAPPAPSGLMDEDLSEIMNRAGLMRKWLDAVEAETLARLEAGRPVPSWKLVRGKRGNRAWSGEEDAISAVLRENYGLANETIYKQTLLSPSAMFDLPVVKENPDLLKAFVTQKEGAICAAPASDKRPAIVTHEAIAAQFTTVD